MCSTPCILQRCQSACHVHCSADTCADVRALQPSHTGPLPPPSLADAVAALEDPDDLGALHITFTRPPAQAWLARLPANQGVRLLLFAGSNLERPVALCIYQRLSTAGHQLAVPACAVVKLERVFGLQEDWPPLFAEWLLHGSEVWVPLANYRLLPLPPLQPQPEDGGALQLAPQPPPQQLQPQQQVAQPAAVTTGWVSVLMCIVQVAVLVHDHIPVGVAAI